MRIGCRWRPLETAGEGVRLAHNWRTYSMRESLIKRLVAGLYMVAFNRGMVRLQQEGERSMGWTKRPLLGLVALLATLLFNAGSATASGVGYSPAPGFSYNKTVWYTSSKTSTSETLSVTGVGFLIGKANSCKYGMSVWYTDTRGVRRNIYQVQNGCTWSPTWWFNTAKFTAKKGTTVQATYRWDGAWYPGHTFRIK